MPEREELVGKDCARLCIDKSRQQPLRSKGELSSRSGSEVSCNFDWSLQKTM